MTYPEKIGTIAELEDALSQPTERDIAAMAALDGDVMLLGAGGKMGPSLARLAEAFGARVLVLPRCESGNTVACAWRDGGPPLDPADWPASAMALKRETGLDLRATFARVDRGQASLAHA